MLDELEPHRSGIRGPLYWSLPDDRTIYEIAEDLLASGTPSNAEDVNGGAAIAQDAESATADVGPVATPTQ